MLNECVIEIKQNFKTAL